MDICLLACINISTVQVDLTCTDSCYSTWVHLLIFCRRPHALIALACADRAGWASTEPSPASSSPNANLNILLACCLLLLSGLFSGLTLGLMSLDMVSLEILAEGGEEQERECAKQILPIRAKGNLLLCTLLLGNTMVNGELFEDQIKIYCFTQPPLCRQLWLPFWWLTWQMD